MRSFLLRLESYFKRMPERDQKIFPYFLFVCIFILFYFGLIQPTRHKTLKLKNDNSNLEQKIFMLKSRVSILGTVEVGMKKKEGEYQRLLEDFKELKSRVPSADEVSKIIKTFASAQNVNYLIRSVAEKNYVKKDSYTEIPMSVTLSGDYKSIYNFLKRVEDAKRFFLLNGMTLTARSDVNGSVDASIDVSAFKIMDIEYYIKQLKNKGKKVKGNEKK